MTKRRRRNRTSSLAILPLALRNAIPITPSRRPSSAELWAIVVAIAMTLYPLSVGPAEWMRTHGLLSPAVMVALKWFYLPLAWLENHSESFSRAMFWYEHLWTG
jgi:hypothetical protein